MPDQRKFAFGEVKRIEEVKFAAFGSITCSKHLYTPGVAHGHLQVLWPPFPLLPGSRRPSTLRRVG